MVLLTSFTPFCLDIVREQCACRYDVVDTGYVQMMESPRTAVSFVVGRACEESTRCCVYREKLSTMVLPASPVADVDDDDLHSEVKIKNIALPTAMVKGC